MLAYTRIQKYSFDNKEKQKYKSNDRQIEELCENVRKLKVIRFWKKREDFRIKQRQGNKKILKV